MLKRLLAGWLGLALMVVSSLACAEPAHYKIVTGPERGTYIQIGQDLSKWVAQPAGIDLEVMASKGSAENVQRMRFEPGVKLALVQSDVYQAYIDMANAGNADAGTAIRPLRLVMPGWPCACSLRRPCASWLAPAGRGKSPPASR